MNKHVLILLALLPLFGGCPTYNQEIYDRDICDLRANAQCREDAECDGKKHPHWREYHRQCMEDYGYQVSE